MRLGILHSQRFAVDVARHRAAMEKIVAEHGLDLDITWTQINQDGSVGSDFPAADCVVVSNVMLPLDHPSLKSITGVIKLGRYSSRLPLARLEQLKIKLEVVPDFLAVSCGEQAVALTFALFRRVVELDSRVRAGDNPNGIVPVKTSDVVRHSNWLGLEEGALEVVSGKTVGILGLGEMGLETALRFRALGCTVFYNKRKRLAVSEEAQWGLQYSEFHQLLRTCDILSLHLPYTAETSEVLGHAELAQMSPQAVLINTARGGLVNEAALIDALTSGKLRGAGLDVFDIEPLPGTSPFVALPNVVLSPHVSVFPSVFKRRYEPVIAAVRRMYELPRAA